MRLELILISGLLVFAQSSAATPMNRDQITRLIADLGSTAGTPIIDVAVTTNADLCYEGRFDRETGVTLISAETEKLSLFHSASISKLFTAIAVFQLRDEGKLSLNDRVGQYLPAFKKHEIRLKHLLTHTSGLRDRKRANGRSTQDEVDVYIEDLAAQRGAKTLGTVWHYADAGFNLLGRVIEKVAGEPFASFMSRRLLKPLEMSSSSFDVAKIPQELRTAGYSKRGRQLQHPWDIAFLPSSGLQTNARDLARFARAVLRVSLNRDNPDFLRFETLQEMTTVQIATDWGGIDQGYAWQLVGSGSESVWRHAGGEAGMESLLAIYPESGNAIVAMGNQKDWPRFQLVNDIKKALTKATTCVGVSGES